MKTYYFFYLLFSSVFSLHSLTVPTGPHFIPCPSAIKNLLRSSISRDLKQSLCPQESQYIASRRDKVALPAYSEYLQNVQSSLGKHSLNAVLPDYVVQIFQSRQPQLLPRTGFAVSGGGLRATLYSLGVLSAFERGNQLSREVGTGGLLNAADYISGLSGGSWTVVALIYGAYDLGSRKLDKLLPNFDLFAPGQDSKTHVASGAALNEAYTQDAFSRMSGKVQAGFKVTIADLWGLYLRYHTLGQTTAENFFDFSLSHGNEETFSGMRNLPSFRRFAQPYPILTALAMSPGQVSSQRQPSALVPITADQYEFTPYETGSWYSDLSSFIPTEYLGTRLRAGMPVDRTKCANKFDQSHYLMGISSDIFPSMNQSTQYFFEKSSVKSLVQAIDQNFAKYQLGTSIDTASVPNPFFQSGGKNYLDRNSFDLRLLDGGLDGAVTPYQPLLIPARRLDVIIGIDAISLDSDQGYNYATGGSLRATFARAELESSHRFPKIPESSEAYLTLRNHPNFFGCEQPETALVIWLPNSAPLDGSRGVTNSSIDRVQYSIQESEQIISAAAEIAYRGLPTEQSIQQKRYRDPLWPACLACAVADRSRARMRVQREGLCADCFERYCWKA